MKDGWDSNHWDENWEEDYFTPEERLRDQAERSLNPDPLQGYGLDETGHQVPGMKSEEELAYEQQRRYSRGRLRSHYQVFTKEQAAKLKI